MKSILFLTPNGTRWGGSEYLWHQTALYCVAMGIRVCVAIDDSETMPVQIDEMIKDGKVEFVFQRMKLSLAERLLNRVLSAAQKHDLIKEFKLGILGWKPDFVIISQGFNGESIEMMNFLVDHQIRYVTISQAAIDYFWPSSNDSELMERGYKNAEKNYFVSKANLDLTEMQIGAPLTNGKVIRNPYNVPYDNNLAFPDTSRGFKLACISRYEIGNKGQDVLMRVLEQKKWRERDISFTFYGSGPHRQSIQKMLTNFKIENAILGDYLKTIDIWKLNHGLIMPTRFEGLPLALVEAMLCGRFGIVTNVSGNKEVIENNINGFLAEAPQMEYLDGALERAWDLRHNWEHIGETARTYIKTLVPENPIEVFYNEIKTFF